MGRLYKKMRIAYFFILQGAFRVQAGVMGDFMAKLG
jgi:hypothetical protein